MLCNVKTCWISTHQACLFLEYCALVLKMLQDINTNGQARAKLSLLTNLECLLGLACLTPVVHALGYLIKFSQVRNCFFGDMVAIVKIWNSDVYSQYVDTMSH